MLILGLPVIAAELPAQPLAQPVANEARPLDAATMSALGITESAATETARSPRPAPESGTWSWTPGQYSYDGSGNITAIGAEASFLYDVRGRLVDANLTRAGATEHREYDYDPFGNRTSMTVGSSSIPTATSTATNHLTGLSAVYDAAGNITQLQPPGQATIYQQKYDALGSLQEVKASSAGAPTHLYIYTADDERLWTFDLAANASHWKIRDLDGKVLRDYYVPGTTWTLSRDYVYRGGQLLAAITPSETLHFSLDHLGTPRVITSANRIRVGFHYYFPFGEEWTDQTGAQEGETMKFTGHERDADVVSGGNNGFDYMHARYYSANIGRFLSIDPASGNPAEPQTWNRYAYARNNPIGWVDPDGRWATPIHQDLIRHAFPGLTPNQLNLILRSDRQQDQGLFSQAARNAYTHGMRAWYQSVPAAEAQAAEFYRSWMAYGKMHAEHGAGSPAMSNAYMAMGKLTHLIADLASPAHAGFQPWGLFPPIGVAGHSGRETTISPELAAMIITMMRVAFGEMFGEEALAQAIQPPPPPVIRRSSSFSPITSDGGTVAVFVDGIRVN